MFNKEKFLTVEIYGFDGQSHQADLTIKNEIRLVDSKVQALVLVFKINPTDLEEQEREYIKIISSNRGLADKVFDRLKVLDIFKDCYFGILPYHDIICPSKVARKPSRDRSK